MAADNRAALRARIRALMGMTQAAGCTEAEAETAAAIAARLIARHGLDPETIMAPEVLGLDVALRPMHGRIAFVLANGVARHCCTEVWGQRAARQLVAVTFFGFEPDVLVAEYLMEVLLGATDRATREYQRHDPAYRRKRKAKTRAPLAEAFRVSMAANLVRRLAMMQAETTPPERARRDAAIKAAMAERDIELRETRRPPRQIDWASDAARAGRRAAEGVALNDGIGAGALQPARIGRPS